jgi:XRE family aerobic/anaerobic benzoate catabolism transcriptional regulator
LLQGREEADLRRVRTAIGELLGTGGASQSHRSCVALVGLRGAGKSTLGQLLADDLGFPFVELSREIEKFAGCSVSEIQALYGQNAYRRYERRALEEAIQIYPEAVIATPGGLVSDLATFNQLLTHCTTVWLQADPEDHMKRVQAQGDLRPMAASKEAMEDLRGILAGRAALYSKAQMHLNTSAQPLQQTFLMLRQMVRQALQLPA